MGLFRSTAKARKAHATMLATTYDARLVRRQNNPHINTPETNVFLQGSNDPDANKITYIGPDGNNGENDRNRVASGCNFNNPFWGSVCTNFPFSQKFSDNKQAAPSQYQCDEWPPAMAQQIAFGSPGRIANSLRCMPHGENESLGSKLGNYVRSKTMVRDDFFRVDFLTGIASADPAKTKFCQPRLDCGSDGLQFGLVNKPVGGGKVSAPYNYAKDDNTYALQGTIYAELYQCGVRFTRRGDWNIEDVVLDNWDNKDVQTTTRCSLLGLFGCRLQGLPHDLWVRSRGTFGSKLGFEYGPSNNVNHFTWDSDMSGNGRGPWTDPATDPNRDPLRFCKVVPGSAPNTQEFECWFPCYKNADGQ